MLKLPLAFIMGIASSALQNDKAFKIHSLKPSIWVASHIVSQKNQTESFDHAVPNINAIFWNSIDITYEELKNRVITILFNVRIIFGVNFWCKFPAVQWSTPTLCLLAEDHKELLTTMKLNKTSCYWKLTLIAKMIHSFCSLRKIVQKSIIGFTSVRHWILYIARVTSGCETDCFKLLSNCT